MACRKQHIFFEANALFSLMPFKVISQDSHKKLYKSSKHAHTISIPEAKVSLSETGVATQSTQAHLVNSGLNHLLYTLSGTSVFYFNANIAPMKQHFHI